MTRNDVKIKFAYRLHNVAEDSSNVRADHSGTNLPKIHPAAFLLPLKVAEAIRISLEILDALNKRLVRFRTENRVLHLLEVDQVRVSEDILTEAFFCRCRRHRGFLQTNPLEKVTSKSPNHFAVAVVDEQRQNCEEAREEHLIISLATAKYSLRQALDLLSRELCRPCRPGIKD